MESGNRNLFITGKAGTGKSTLLRHFCEEARKNLVVLAPTGVAAINAGGQTVHRFFRFRADVTPESVKKRSRPPGPAAVYRRLQILIIDEASMLRADLLDCIDIFLKKFGPIPNAPFGGVQMIFIGDLFQLPPVVISREKEIFSQLYDSPYFFSAKALADIKLEIIELEKVYRQSEGQFLETLNRIRDGVVLDSDIAWLNERVDPNFEVPENEYYVTLTSTNKKADDINLARLSALDTEIRTSHARISGDFGKEYYPAQKDLKYKSGAQIMLLNNDPAGRWVNGSIGTITDVNPRRSGSKLVKIHLRESDCHFEVGRHEWQLSRFELVGGSIKPVQIGTFKQLPFRLAWAITIHKSQGKTFKHMVVDLERIFSPGQAYVAFSRGTSYEGLVLLRPLKASAVRTDWRVREFLAKSRFDGSAGALSEQDKAECIERAIRQGTNLRITYLDSKGQRTDRHLRPIEFGTQTYAGKQFQGLKAFCLTQLGDRTFRVDRIVTLEQVD